MKGEPAKMGGLLAEEPLRQIYYQDELTECTADNLITLYQTYILIDEEVRSILSTPAVTTNRAR